MDTTLTPHQTTEHLLRERLALTAYICSITRNYHLAEDVYQGICVKAVSEADKFSDNSHLINWFLRQIAAYQDDALSEAELAHLDQTLHEDADRRRCFIEVQERSAALAELFREDAFSTARNTDHQTTTLFRRRAGWFAATVFAIAGCIALAIWLQPRGAVAPGDCAAITYASQAHWEGASSETPEAGKYLRYQVFYRLEAGSVRMQMEAGAIVSIAAPASFRIVDAAKMEMETGKLTARLPDQSSELLVRAGELEIRDLGTAFGITTDQEGKLDVAVFDGSISVRSLDASSDTGQETFREGQAIASSGDSQGRKEIPYEPGKYQDIWPLTIGIDEASAIIDFVPPGPRPPLESLAHDHISFQHPILGVAVTPKQLRQTDSTFGIPGINYKSFAGRRVEDKDTENGRLPADSLRISDDRRQLYLNLHVGALTDHIRVLVEERVR